jgi:hypothetical protein
MLWKYWILGSIFAAAFHLFIVVLGARLVACLPEGILPARLKAVAAPAVGIVTFAAAVAIVLPVSNRMVQWITWGLAAWLILDVRRTRVAWRECGLQTGVLVAAVGYALYCLLVALTYHASVPDESQLVWSIYRLTAVTPGDSPQGLMQAQILWHGSQLQQLKDFSLFDRPFLGGYITAGALSALGLRIPVVFWDYPSKLQVAYFALWLSANSLVIHGFAALRQRVLPDWRGGILMLIVLLSPSVLFNTIGAWPKPLAVYLLIVCWLLALEARFVLAAAAAAFAFLTHGSFILPLFACVGAFVVLVMFDRFISWPARLREILAIGGAGLLPVAAWFAVERASGVEVPLRSYYLFNVDPTTALYQSAESIRAGFYRSGSPGNLDALPWLNLVKSVLPLDLLSHVAKWSYALEGWSWRRLGSILGGQAFYQIPFAFGMASVWVAAIGLKRTWRRDWGLALSLCICIILPLAAGAALYRRDNVLTLVIFLGAWIPMILAFAHGLSQLGAGALRLVALLALAEYTLVLLAAYPAMRYSDVFYAWYPLLVEGTLLLAVVFVLRISRAAADHPPGDVPLRTEPAVSRRHLFTSGKLVGLAIVGGLAVMLAVPPVLEMRVGVGGFDRYGWTQDLMGWENVEMRIAGQSPTSTRLRWETGEPMWWINTGQAVKLRKVPVATATVMEGWFRVHPEWQAGTEAPSVRVQLRIADGDSIALHSVDIPVAARRGVWQQFRIDLRQHAGRAVDLEIAPVADQNGVWTLWRGLRLVPAGESNPWPSNSPCGQAEGGSEMCGRIPGER